MPCLYTKRPQPKQHSGLSAKARSFMPKGIMMGIGMGMGIGMAMMTAIALHPFAAKAQDTSLEVLTINGQGYSLNLVGSIINQLPENVRNQPIDVYYNSVIDDIVDTKLTANAANESGLAKNPLLKEIA